MYELDTKSFYDLELYHLKIGYFPSIPVIKEVRSLLRNTSLRDAKYFVDRYRTHDEFEWVRFRADMAELQEAQNVFLKHKMVMFLGEQ